MEAFLNIDWAELFIPSAPVVETIIRGTLVYWFLFLIFRLVIKRDIGSVAVTDLIVVVIIADAAQNAMAADYNSITDGLILISTIVFWNFLLDWAAYRFRWFERFMAPEALKLIKDGRILHRNLRREFLTEEELIRKVRESGVEDLSQIQAAYMEGDGTISVIKRGA
ncbi:DUF421 domain-containing protein [Methylocaldum sp.]|uniref:DUF421 domain-containing protein n=1 Tax=Methylocaldum sp. TaxID=1969727 RepID=UPI002D2EF4F6|nr:YetF domain-containing protein [Methylocaldum sp.]HYE37295.1 YetF domain-containing protein [Methylocaldum sp.]